MTLTIIISNQDKSDLLNHFLHASDAETEAFALGFLEAFQQQLEGRGHSMTSFLNQKLSEISTEVEPEPRPLRYIPSVHNA